MADWTAPFHRPHMSSEEFDKVKKDYVEKYGYTVTIPGPEEIFHFGVEKPMTAEEQVRWKYKAYDSFDPERLEEIKYMKKKRKEAYQAMLSSPSPKIVNARASIIGAIDDAQDALSTLAVVGTLGYMAVSTGIKKMIAGPLGWTMTAATGLNYVNKALVPERRMLANKKTTETTTKNGPKSSQAKYAIEKKAKELGVSPQQIERMGKVEQKISRLKSGGWSGAIIEALQVTDNVYGQGISLGALMNLPYDFAAGIVRGGLGGTPIHLKTPGVDIDHYERVARKLVRNWLSFEGIPKEYRVEEHHSPVVETAYPGIPSFMSDEDEAQMRIALFLAQQTIHMRADEINTLDMENEIEDLELMAPMPTNPLTLEVIREAGDRPENGCAWPATGEKWSNARNLIEESSTHIRDNLNDYTQRNNHSVTGWAVTRHAVDAGLYALENMMGTGTVQIENTPSYSAINSLQWLNFCVDRELSDKQRQGFTEYLQQCDDTNYTPSGKEVIDYAEKHCGFGFIQSIT